MTATCYTQEGDKSKLWCVTLVIALASLLMLVPGVVSATPPAQEGQEGQIYTVQGDDTLWSIAEKYLGDGSAYTTIVAATNSKHEQDATFARIDNPNVIKLGWKLFIPGVEVATEPETPTPTPGAPTPTPTPGTPTPTPETPIPTPTPETPVPTPETPTPTPTPEEGFPPVTPTNELTISVNYFYAITALFIVLFALIGFALGQNRSLGALFGIFFAYVAADKGAEFLRDALNFVLKLELGDEFITYFKGIIFFLAIIGVLGYIFGTHYSHTCRSRISGMLTGILTGYLVSVFALEFLRELLVGWLEGQTAMFDFSYDLLGQEGLFVVTLNFFSDPEAAYTLLRKALVPAILITLFVVLERAFQWFIRVLGRILNTIIGWVSIRGRTGETEAT